MTEELSKNRRPGPIGFSGESSITSNRMTEAPNPGGIGRATTLRKETPRTSKELKVSGPWLWMLVGTVVIVLGVVSISVPVIAAGVAICVSALMVSRMNRTQQRLRRDIRNNPE